MNVLVIAFDENAPEEQIKIVPGEILEGLFNPLEITLTDEVIDGHLDLFVQSVAVIGDYSERTGQVNQIDVLKDFRGRMDRLIKEIE